MKFFKHFVLAIAFFAATFAAAAVTARADTYRCDNSIFGCWTVYTGPVDEDAAQAYLQDSQEAVAWTVNTYPEVASVYYRAAEGGIVLRLNPEVGRFYDAAAVMQKFSDMNLHVTYLRVVENQMRYTISQYPNRSEGLGHGRARYSALKYVKMGNTGATKANTNTLKAFSKTRTDTFGGFIHER